MGTPGGQSKSCNSPQGRVHSPLPFPAKFDQVTHHYKLLCKSPQEPLLGGGTASAFEQKCYRTVNNSEISTVSQQTFSGSKTKQPVLTYLGPQYPEQVFKDREIPPNLSPAYTDTGSSLSGVRLVGQLGKIKTGTLASLRLCRLPVWPGKRQGQTHNRALADLTSQDTRPC